MIKALLKDKSMNFAIRVVNLSKVLRLRNEFIISKQLIRSGTAIGALIREAEFAESKPDFLHKLHISLKEANETQYWIELLFKTKYLTEDEYKSIFFDVNELVKMLVAITKKLKESIKN
jgi:four helix bundle protein